MTPLPKNKITRAERGKRRSGNTPKLLRQGVSRVATPKHKDKIVQRLKLVLRPGKKIDEAQAKAELAAKMAGKKGHKVK